MLTKNECLMKAEAMELQASAHLSSRPAFLRIAKGWRKLADTIAREEEAEGNPDADR